MSRKYDPKKDKNQKNIAIENPDIEQEKSSKTISKLTNKKIKEALKDFSKLDEKEKKEFGDGDFFEQFWEFFKENHPNLLDEIGSENELQIQIENIEKMGFSLENLIQNSSKLHQEFKETTDEKSTICQNLEELQKYCEDSDNKMPANIFKDFADEIKFDISPNIEIRQDTKITKIGEISKFWKRFLEDNNITLKSYQKNDLENIIKPKYLPTERLLISATIKKIKKQLPDSLISSFETEFPTPINIHSEIQNLQDFKNRWVLFLDGNRVEIDEKLAKKLDKMIISNADIYKELQYEGNHIKWNAGFTEQSQNFKLMFNKLATRQLFESTEKTEIYLEHHLQEVGDEFKTYPPYFSYLLEKYPYQDEYIGKNSSLKSDYDKENKLLTEKEGELSNNQLSETQKGEIYQEIKKIKNRIHKIKRKAYAEFIENQESEFSGILSILIENDFDLNKLSKENQQKIINSLIKKKLEDSKHKEITKILGVDADKYQKFIEDLFDLDKKEITIPTPNGDKTLKLLEKNFLSGNFKDFVDIENKNELLEKFKTLPINLKLQIDKDSQIFFEDNILFENLFETFNSKNGKVKLNDNYKISIKRTDGVIVSGYLSQTPPIQSAEHENIYQNGRFLYSSPITESNQDREIITRDGKNPVVIPADQENENKYEINILSKELNLNGEGISALLFANVLGQSNIKNHLSREQEKKLYEKFGQLDRNKFYKDTIDNYKEILEEKKESPEEIKQKEIEKNKKEFLEERKNLGGHQEKDYEQKEGEANYGFKKGAKLIFQGGESGLTPLGSFRYFGAEITNITDTSFKIKFKGNEVNLGKYEGREGEFPLSKDGLNKILDAFDRKAFKLVGKPASDNILGILSTMETGQVDGIDPNASFKGIGRDGQNFTTSFEDKKDQPVQYFGLVETLPGENPGEESKSADMYKIEHNSRDKTFTLTANDKDKSKITLDYPSFILFISSRGLQPQTEETAKKIHIEKSEGATLKEPKKRKAYSIASIIGTVKNFGKKIGDGLKKYEESQVEGLTDSLFHHGKLFHKLAGIMPTAKLQAAFSEAGNEYMLERDNKIWAKIEAYIKIYESDPDFGGKYIRETRIQPYLDGTKKPENPQQIAAILLVTIKKGRGPYSRNTDRAGKGKRVRLLFGEEHQARYLAMKEKMERELRQGHKSYGQSRANDLQNEILKLEMKYIVHCVDGRHLRVGDDDVDRLGGMYSKKFASELEGAYNTFFDETTNKSVESAKSASFELARFEYFRQLPDRPQQALGYLKQMAAKAVSPMQKNLVRTGILTGMLSGNFQNITQEDKGLIQKISRTIGFLPGVRIKDPNHHLKTEKIIEIAIGEKIRNYNSAEAAFGTGKSLGRFKEIAGMNSTLAARLTESGRIDKINQFISMKGKNKEGKTLIEILNDPKTPKDIKDLLAEVESKSLEKDEDLDYDIKKNGAWISENILSKNQSFVGEITDFQNGEFRGKDKDEKQGTQEARKQIAKEIPKNKIDNDHQVGYILKKFMNRFENKGFNVEEKKQLIQVLRTIKEEESKGRTEGLDELLRYTIAGNVIGSSGNGQPPAELRSGLEAFKSFFKSNIDTILKPTTIERSMGGMFVAELDKKILKIAPWNDFIDVTKNRVIFRDNPQKRNERSQKQQIYKMPNIFLNERIYRKAEAIERRNHIPNMFDKYFSLDFQKQTQEELQKTLDPANTIQLKNREIAHKALKNLAKHQGGRSIDPEILAELGEDIDPNEENIYDEYSEYDNIF